MGNELGFFELLGSLVKPITFAAIFLIFIFISGGEIARILALVSAFFGVISISTRYYSRVPWWVPTVLGHISMALAVAGFVLMIGGK